MTRRHGFGDDWYAARIRAGSYDPKMVGRHFLPEHEPEPHLPLDQLRNIDDRTVDVAGDALDHAEMAERAHRLEWLDRRSRRVLEERILHEETLEAIGHDLDLTRERIRQIENEAKKRLRGPEPPNTWYW